MQIVSRGSGPDLVLLHGWGMHAGVWDDLAGRLESEFRLHLVDLPGHGGNPRGERLGELADRARELVERLPEAIWLGWSLGALLALEAALTRPRRLRGLVLVAGTPRFVAAPDWPEGMAPAVYRRFAEALESDYVGTLERFMALEVHGSDTERRDLKALRELAHAYEPPARRSLRDGLRWLEQSDLRDRLDRIACPSMIVGGRRDRLVSPAALRRFARLLPGARLELMPGCGHAPFIGHPRRFLNLLRDFIEEIRHRDPAA